MRPAALLVVDHDDTRILLAELVEHEGIECHQAVNGLDALAMLRPGVAIPDCIVLDLALRTRDAHFFRAAQMKDERLRDIPLIVLTQDGDEAFGLGAELVLLMPSAIGEVGEAIADVLRARASPRACAAQF